MTILASCVLPVTGICDDRKLYFSVSQEDSCFLEGKILRVSHGNSVNFGTYFNAFSLSKWHKYTAVEDLTLVVDFDGEAIVDIWHAIATGEKEKISSIPIHHNSRRASSLGVHCYGRLTGGLIFFTLNARSDVRFYAAYFTTKTPPLRNISLGIVIATYRREVEVIRNVARLVKTSHTINRHKIDIVVVDNAKTLTPEDVSGAVLLPNRNLGGSGGFMRGLLHLETDGVYTHCLFMDDDAFCEAESIFRAITFLSFAVSDAQAMAGAMLEQQQMHIQYENMAYFDTVNHPLHSNLNLHSLENICRNEHEKLYSHLYGAWWFFIFPLKFLKNYAFPFFIRGDDILFSLTNIFKITSINGVSCWHPKFDNKESTMTTYLSMRSILVINTIIRKNNIFLHFILLKYIFLECLLRCFTYRYESAQCILKAFSDYMKGPEFWYRNIDMFNVRKFIKTLTSKEIFYPLRPEQKLSAFRMSTEPRCPRYISTILCLITLGGHLLPTCLMDKKAYWMVPIENRGLIKLYWRKRQCTIIDIHNKSASIMTINRLSFFKIILSLSILLFTYTFSLKKICTEYKNSTLMSRTFWKSVL